MRPLMRLVASGTLAAVVTLGVIACSPPPSEEDQSTLTLPGDVYAGNWNPAAGGDMQAGPWQAVYDVLAVWRPDENAFEPRLAEEVEISEDGLTMRIRLRDDVEFTDGEHMTAAGVATYFTALEGSLYVYGDRFPRYGLTFVATDEYALELRATKRIYIPDFIHVLGGTPVLSSRAVEGNEAVSTPLAGSGPYVLDSEVVDAEKTFVRNDDYWDPETYPYDVIVFKNYPDGVSALNALKTGQIDVTALGPEYAAEAEAAGLRVTESGGYYRTLWIYDPVNSPVEALRDVRVRQAMSYAFDRETIAETIDLGYARVTSQAFQPGMPEYIEGGDDRYPYDLEKARELMAEAGYADGFDIVIPTYPDSASVEPIVQQSLADIGIRVTYQQFADRGEWFKEMGKGAWPLILEPGHGPYYTLFGLTADWPGYGRTFAYNADIEELVATIKEGTPEESAAASQEIGRLMLEEAWYIPFSAPTSVWASSPDVLVDANTTEVTIPVRPELRSFTPAE